jgi:hypothetical protein
MLLLKSPYLSHGTFSIIDGHVPKVTDERFVFLVLVLSSCLTAIRYLNSQTFFYYLLPVHRRLRVIRTCMTLEETHAILISCRIPYPKTD